MMLAIKLLFVLVLACPSTAQVRTIVNPAKPSTHAEETITIEAYPITYKDETITVSATTFIAPAFTTTLPAMTATLTRLPAKFHDLSYAHEIYTFASSVSSLDPNKLSAADSALSKYLSDLSTQTPFLIQTATFDLLYAYQQRSLNRDQHMTVLKHMLTPFYPSYTTDIAAALTSDAALSSKVMEYMPLAQSWMASSLSEVGRIVSQELSLTGEGPSIASAAAAITAGTTTAAGQGRSSSSEGAAATVTAAIVGVRLNTGAAIVGMMILGLM